jgi:hypothetical protein
VPEAKTFKTVAESAAEENAGIDAGVAFISDKPRNARSGCQRNAPL